MANALIYTQSGGGKTVNSTLVAAPKRKKNLLICSDNSSIVLKNFDRQNLTIQNVGTVKDFVEAYQAGYNSKQYDNIILDNLSDLIDMWLLELDASGKFKDFRQAYQLVYQSLKRLSRESAMLDCNTIFTCWSDNMEIMNRAGVTVWIDRSAEQTAKRLSPYGRQKRPKLRGLSDEELVEFMQRNMEERKAFYSQAQHHIEVDALSDYELSDRVGEIFSEAKI
jgi:hypothetical protein